MHWVGIMLLIFFFQFHGILIIADKTNKMLKQIRKINQQPITSAFLGNQGCISQHNGQKKNQKRVLESGLGYQNYDSPKYKTQCFAILHVQLFLFFILSTTTQKRLWIKWLKQLLSVLCWCMVFHISRLISFNHKP